MSSVPKASRNNKRLFLLAAILPGEDFTLDVHSIIFGKSSRAERTSFYGNMRNFYFNGHYLFDHMTSGPLINATTQRPDYWRDFDAYSWILYDLALFPSSYHSRSYQEAFELIFRTSHPDGLIWFTGNEQNNMHLSMKVHFSFSFMYLFVIKYGNLQHVKKLISHEICSLAFRSELFKGCKSRIQDLFRQNQNQSPVIKQY